MRYPLTIVYITARKDHCFHWVKDGLALQLLEGERVNVIMVDFNGGMFATPSNAGRPDIMSHWHGVSIANIKPKPTVWQGEHRITTTEQHWWAASNARNTGICLCQTPWIAFLDDRCVLQPGWLQGIRRAMDDNYIVAGRYEKRNDVVVDDGTIQTSTEFPNNSGKDPRWLHVSANKIPTPFECGGEWLFGCSLALPLEWALSVNGYDETCDGLGMEDVMFGTMLRNAGYPIKYDPEMFMVEDRTPGHDGHCMKREDKGVSPNDKSHALLAMLKDRKTAMHGFDIRQVRRDVLAGKPWPKPWGPFVDWYDNQPVSEMK